MSLFEKASKSKLRFPTSKGNLPTEDLWDLSLESLDTLAISVDKQIETAGKKSFIGKKTTGNAVSELQLEILKHIIDVKLAEKEAKTARDARNVKLSQLKELAASKSTEALQGLSLEEITKMIKDLQEAD